MMAWIGGHPPPVPPAPCGRSPAGREKHDGALESLCEQFFASLCEMARSLSALTDFSPAVRDRLLSAGELLSTQFLCEVLQDEGVPGRLGRRAGCRRHRRRHGQAEPLLLRQHPEMPRGAPPLLERGLVPSPKGSWEERRRRASRRSGGAARTTPPPFSGRPWAPEEIEIWTDVDGVMTADPASCPGRGVSR